MRRIPVQPLAAALLACLIFHTSPVAGADGLPSRGVSGLVFNLTTYDSSSRPLQHGQGLITGEGSLAVVPLVLLEGAVTAVAVLADERTLPVNGIHGEDETAGIALVRLGSGAPRPLDKGAPGEPPVTGERIIFSASTPAGRQVCGETVVVSVNSVRGLAGIHYIETTRPLPPTGGTVYGSDGSVAGMIIMRFGSGTSGVLASGRRIEALSSRAGRSSSLALWSRSRPGPWSEGPHARYMAGRAALWRGQPLETLRILSSDERDWPVLTPEMWTLLGEAYLSLDRLPEAITALQAAADCGHAPCWTWQNLAWAYMETGQPEQAEEACLKFMSLKPESPTGYLLMAHLRNMQGDYKGAVYEARRALLRNPDCPCAHFERGRAYLGQGRYESAIDSMTSAVTLDPEYGDAYHYLGYAYLRNRDAWSAVTMLEEAVKRDPERAETWDTLGEAYAAAGLGDEALNAFRLAVCLDPAGSNTYCRLARELIRQGLYQEAAGIVNRALDSYGESPWLVYYLGKAYLNGGRVDLARAQVQRLYEKNRKLSEQLSRIIDQGQVSSPDSNGMEGEKRLIQRKTLL